MFNIEEFLRERGTNKVTSIKFPTGHKLRLEGEPDEETDKGLADLAKRQPDTVKVQSPKFQTGKGYVTGQRRRELAGGDVSEMLQRNAGIWVETPVETPVSRKAARKNV